MAYVDISGSNNIWQYDNAILYQTHTLNQQMALIQ